MKKLFLLISFMVLTFSIYAQEAPSAFTANFKGGLFLGGPGKPNYGGLESNPNVSPFLKADLDGILVPKLSMGLFLLYTPMKVEEIDEATNILSVGMTIKPRFTVAEGVQVRPAVAIGYNYIKNSLMDDPSNGLNIGFQIEVSKRLQNNMGVVGELGFVSQPVGGDGNFDLTFPPIFYICIGIEFGK